MNPLFTVGHSAHPLDTFIDLLMLHGVNAVCDVRSVPHSKRNPQFDRERLKAALRGRGIAYVFLGKELGARTSDPACYVDGRAEYRLIARTPAFTAGLERVRRGLQSYRVALMCAEQDPLSCHRTILVCRHLRDPGVRMAHILPNGTIESHAHLEQRMLAEVGLESSDLFESTESLVERAYDLHGERIAYVSPSARPGPSAPYLEP